MIIYLFKPILNLFFFCFKITLNFKDFYIFTIKVLLPNIIKLLTIYFPK